MRLKAVIPLLALLAAGCADERGVMSGDPAASKLRFVPPPGESPGPETPLEVPARKLIRTVDLDLRVEDPDAAAAAVRQLTSETGGYVSEVNAYRVDGLLHQRISIRVPAEALDAVLARLKALAVKVEREHLRTEDVTEKFVDLEAHLRTLRLTEQELQALLAEARSRGSKADEIMTIYGYLTEIRTNIERLQGQLNALDSLVTYSTVNLELVPTEAARPLVADRWRPGEVVRGGFRMLLSALEFLANAAILLVVVVGPIALLLGLAGWLVVKGWRRLRSRRRSAQ